MDHNDREQLCTFFSRSRYDIIQARQGDGWGPVWTFAPCDPRAAAKTAQMLLKMHRGSQLRVRHARRARLRDRQCATSRDVIIVTDLPARVQQEVLGVADGIVLRVDVYLQDDALAALEAELAHSLDGAAVR